MQEVEIEEAKVNLADLVEAALNGDEIVLKRDNQPVVKLVAIPQVVGPKEKPRRKAGSLKGQIWMSDDFDEPLEDFDPYMR